MKKLILLSPLFLLFFHCDLNNAKELSIQDEINALKTIEQQKSYLENIRTIDQSVRDENQKILKESGKTSQEYITSTYKMWGIDTTHFKKIETYLNTHGHPTLKKHGREAADTPCIIIHHAVGRAEPRIKHFKLLYEAYKKGDLSNTLFTFYLNRMYYYKFNSRIKWGEEYTEELEVDTLIKSLELQPTRLEIDKSLN